MIAGGAQELAYPGSKEETPEVVFSGWGLDSLGRSELIP